MNFVISISNQFGVIDVAKEIKMGLGISKIFNKLLIRKNVFEFYLRRRIFGFENANTILRRVDKNSAIPILIANKAKIGENVDIETPLLFHNCNDYNNLTIGNNCHIGKNCFFDLRDQVVIGDNVVISMQNTFITHLDLSKSESRYIYPARQASVNVNRNVYIGANCTILQGVVLSENCFIAAGSVVTKNVEPFTMVGGIPAKKIKDLSDLKNQNKTVNR